MLVYYANHEQLSVVGDIAEFGIRPIMVYDCVAHHLGSVVGRSGVMWTIGVHACAM